MITRIQALNFRCLRYVDQRVSRFQVLVGANATGKTTFLDVIGFMGSIVAHGVEEAVGERTTSFQDLVWGREGSGFELAIEASIPNSIREALNGSPFRETIRYEVGVAHNASEDSTEIVHERVMLLGPTPKPGNDNVQRDLFPKALLPPRSVFLPRSGNFRSAVKKTPKGNDNFYAEVKPKKGDGGWVPSFRLGPKKSALGSLPADPTRLGTCNWLRGLLTHGVQSFVLNSLLIRRASQPGMGRRLRTDGSNLPWVVEEFVQKSPERHERWLAHLRTALPDLEGIRVVERADDRHKYLMLRYRTGIEIPTWMASDGTLRLLALTLPAYLPEFDGVYLVEEPENGIHPRAVETLVQSLRSVYSAQMLTATHSPVILSQVEPHEVLCFAKTEDGRTDIVRGDNHPALRDWRRDTDLGMLLAGGVLG